MIQVFHEVSELRQVLFQIRNGVLFGVVDQDLRICY
jgi:hypothetical protein